MANAFQGQVQFFVVYSRESLSAGPTTIEQRQQLAEQLRASTQLDTPLLVDQMDNRVGTDYFAWPERAYLIGIDGRVIYRSKAGGPDHAMLMDLQAAISETLSAQN